MEESLLKTNRVCAEGGRDVPHAPFLYYSRTQQSSVQNRRRHAPGRAQLSSSTATAVVALGDKSMPRYKSILVRLHGVLTRENVSVWKSLVHYVLNHPEEKWFNSGENKEEGVETATKKGREWAGRVFLCVIM